MDATTGVRRGGAAARRQAANSFAVKIAGTRTYIAYAILLALAALVIAMLYAAAPARAQTAAPAPASANDPMGAVKGVVDQAIAVFRNRQLSPADRMTQLRAIAEAHIDFASMARSAVGYHWNSLTPDQQAQFVPLFTKFIEDVVLSRIQSYSVEKIQSQIESTAITFNREHINSPDDAQVYSTVVVQDRPNPLSVNYMLRQTDGQWKIFDIQVDAISVIANYRNQFNRVINNEGYDKLVSILRQKTQSLSNSIGQ
ncbi:MAG TPA: ABC transporter substrate-binding protein [Candidatus Binataceae bacterium]|nr:ABC transporter substrate-binding protein [Candidatus Binataceae bacterium]